MESITFYETEIQSTVAAAKEWNVPIFEQINFTEGKINYLWSHKYGKKFTQTLLLQLISQWSVFDEFRIIFKELFHLTIKATPPKTKIYMSSPNQNIGTFFKSFKGAI